MINPPSADPGHQILIEQALASTELDEQREDLLRFWQTEYAQRETPIADIYDDFRALTSVDPPTGTHRLPLLRGENVYDDGSPVDLMQALVSLYLAKPMVAKSQERAEVLASLQRMMTNVDQALVDLWDSYATETGHAQASPAKLIKEDVCAYDFTEHPVIGRHPLDEEGVPVEPVGLLLAAAAVKRIGFLTGFAKPPLRGVPWTQ